ncbi:MAG: DNA alkylation repair protein [Oscillospiraceae bacterium]
MSDIKKEIEEKLFSFADEKYRDFHSSLMPTIPKENIIGVRVPDVKNIAKEFRSREDIGEFLCDLPHRYYEENNLHIFIISAIKDYETCLAEVEKFLPYIDNWATCDGSNPKALLKQPNKFYEKIKVWLKSDKTYTVRYAVDILMNRVYLEDNFSVEHLDLASSIVSDEYYINMAVAWYFATALAKQYESTLPYIEKQKLPVWTHNKAIQKAIESRRVTDEHKEYLKSLKIHN